MVALEAISGNDYYWLDAKCSGSEFTWTDSSPITWSNYKSLSSCTPECHLRVDKDRKWFKVCDSDVNLAICESVVDEDFVSKALARKVDRYEMQTLELDYREHVQKAGQNLEESIGKIEVHSQLSYLNISYQQEVQAEFQKAQEDLEQVAHNVSRELVHMRIALQKLVYNSTTHDVALKSMTTGKLDRSEMEAFKLEHQENARKSMLEFQKTIQGSYLNVSFEQVFRELLQQSQENLMQRQLSCSIAMSEFEQDYQEYGRQSALNTSHQLRNIALTLHKDRAKLYVVSSESLMYLEAKEYCKINGGHVVRLQDEYEAEYIANHVTNQSYWIDAIQNGSKYIWAGKTEIDYTNWKSNQTGCNSETCAIFVEKEDRTWVAVDYTAGGRKMAVCEKDNRLLASRLQEVSPNEFAILALIISLVALAVLNLILVYAHLQMRREMKRLSMRGTRVVYQRSADTCVLSQEDNNHVNLYEPIA
ncbi:hypothetical protein HDE_07961 [Halotydeus destructor]|nr:hypothetical protein HDE_07961 [Halotydeus destructor]